MTTVMTVLVAAVLVTGPQATQSTQKIDVTGRWDVTVNTDQGVQPATLTISRTGDTLAGTIAGAQGEMPVDISLKDKAITITFALQTQNGAIDIAMGGTVDGDQMSGQVNIGDRGTASWTAKRVAGSNGSPQNPPSQQKPAATMTGTWAFEVHHSAGTSTPTVTITQTGEKLSGKYVGTYGESVLTGTIKDNQFTFTVEIGTEQKVNVVYTGTLDGDTVKGSVTMGEMGEGTFTGKRK